VHGTGRLAFRRPQIGFEAPAVAAVEVVVPIERGEDGGGVATVDEQLKAASVEDASVGCEKRDGGGKVDAHAMTLSRARRAGRAVGMVPS
jgi:hypothetical protein